MRVLVKKWGNSATVRIPAPMMESARLAINDAVEIREEGGRIVIEPAERTENDLDQLVARITPANRHKEISYGTPSSGSLESHPSNSRS